MLFRNRFSRSFVFAANGFADQIDAGRESAFIIAITKMRLDTVLSDIERRNIRQRAFQAVTDLNEHLSVCDKDKQHDAITPVLLAYAPHLRDALCVIRDVRVTLHFRKHSNHNLVRSVALKLGQLLIEAMSGFLRNDASVIIKVAVRFRRNDFGGLRAFWQQRSERRDAGCDLVDAKSL